MNIVWCLLLMCWKWQFILNRFADNNKFESAVNILQGSADIQTALDKIKERANRNFLSLSMKKGKVLYLEWTNPLHRYRVGTDWLRSCSA